ncbi:MAG TPA: MFS transporter [Candidatus Anammoximicrobium sp.]|nr:MFS transporter [Candidatus Anammoximicrobium sp.]
MNAAEAKHPPLPRNVKLLGWASLLNDVASEMVYPLLPQFLVQVLGGNKLYLGLIEGAADTAASLLKLGSGGWSDRRGARKGFVVFGYALAGLLRPLLAVIWAPWQLLAIRVGDRVGKGLRTSPRDAMIADSTAPELRGRAFGFHRAMDHLGAALGPVLAAAFLWCWPGQLRWLFLLTLAPGLVIVPLLLFGLREAPPGGQEAARGSWTLAPFDRRFRIYLVAVLVFSLSNSSDAFLLLRAGELGVATALLPLLWCAFHLVKSAGNALAGRSVNRFGPRAMILVGWCLYAAVYLLFGLATAAWHAWALFLGYAFFFALTEPAEKTLVASLVDSDHRGLAYGWFNFAIGLATLPSSLIFGMLYQQYGALAAFGCGSALAVTAAGILLPVSLPRTPRVDSR